MNTIFIAVIILLIIIAYIIWRVSKAQEEEEEIESSTRNKTYKGNRPNPLHGNITLDKWNKGFDIKYNIRADEPILTTLAGVKYNDCESAIKGLVKEGDQLMLLPDPENKYDKTATRVCTKDGWFMGWLPNHEWNDKVFNDLINNKRWDAYVREIRSPTDEFDFYNVLIELWEFKEE
jgi:hypothetical protein